MAFGMNKPTTHRRELSDLPDDWVGWLEPGIEMEGKMKVSSGLVRLNAHFKGEIISDGAVVVHDQGEVEGDIQSRVVSITGKVKGTVHAKERLEIKEHGGFFDGQCHMPAPEPASQTPKAVDPQKHP
jgi:cytoskeletal protein CcmA (bactofilin family)